MAQDPVCGMTVDEKSAAATYNYSGTAYYFCSSACKAQFEKDPQRFVGKAQHGHGGHGHRCC